MVGSATGGGGGGGGSGGGNGGGERSKEAVGMMALHEALRTVCLNTDWTYSVFWTIRPRPRIRGGNGCKVGDDNGSLMLMWEDGFCRGRVGEQCLEEIDSEDPIRKAFSKMSIQLYNYGEGLMGKVASDKCHKWVFKEPSEAEPNVANYWQSSFDALPTEWNEQFESGIQTIAVIQAGHGLLQLGSCKIIPEDLHFVLRMRHTFESLGYQSGFYLSQLFSANRNGSSSSSSMQTTTKQMIHQQHQPLPQFRPPPLFWGQQRPLHHSMLASQTYHHQRPNPHHPLGPFPKDETTMFLMPHSASEPRMDEMTGGGGGGGGGDHHHEQADLKWPNGLSFFNALTGRADDGRSLLFNPDSLGNKPGGDGGGNNLHASTTGSAGNPNNEFLSLDNSHHDHQEGMRKSMEGGKFKRSFTLPARMTSSSSSTSIDQHQSDYRNPEAGMYPDVMESFLE